MRVKPLPALAALVVLAFVWSPALGLLAGRDFPAHMIRHMVLVAIAPPLIVAAIPAWPAALLPAVLVGAVVEFVVVWGWHLPGLHAFARLSTAGFLAEQASFLAAGLLVWSGALAARQPLAGAGGLLLTSMHMTLLGALMILAPRDLYSAACGRPDDLGGQQLGGMLMLAIGTPAYLLGGLWLTGRALDPSEAA